MPKPDDVTKWTVVRSLAFAMMFLVGCAAETPTSELSRAVSDLPAAAIVAHNANQDRLLHVIARTFVNEGTEVFEVYEPEPGVLLLSAAGHPRGPALLARAKLVNKSVDEIWRQLVPGEPLPGVLVAALTRKAERDARLPIHGASSQVLGGKSRSVDDASSTASGRASPAIATAGSTSRASQAPTPQVINGYCDTQWYNDFPPIVGGCTPGPSCECDCNTATSYLEKHVSGDLVAWTTNAAYGYANLCPVVEAASLKISGTYSGSWYVPEDTYRWEDAHGSATCFLFSCIGSSKIDMTAETDSLTLFNDGLYNFLFTYY